MKGHTEEHVVTKQDLKIAAQEIVDAIRAEYLKVIESNKKVMVKVDRLLGGRGVGTQDIVIGSIKRED